jgi:hypothetical protein
LKYFWKSFDLGIAIDLVNVYITRVRQKRTKHKNERQKTMTSITGNTYPVKDQIKALGGRWDAENKCWDVPDDKADAARALVAAAPAKSDNGKKPFVHHKCVVCGVVPTRNSRGYYNVKIYKSGECADCYEERKMGY